MTAGPFDVVVLGAGPAGSTAAALLSRAGMSVALVDRARFPRDKVCGESVSPGAWETLDELGVGDAIRARALPLAGMRVVSPAGRAFQGRYRPDRPAGFGLPRAELDGLILDAAVEAGARLFDACAAIDATERDGGPAGAVVRLRPRSGGAISIAASFVVVADGAGSIVARRLGLLRHAAGRRRFAIRQHLQAPAEDPAGAPAFGQMHVGRRSYCGVAPLGAGRINVSMVVDAAALGPCVGGDLPAFVRSELRRYPSLGAIAEAPAIDEPRVAGPLRLVARTRSRGPFFLAGDCGGFVDPFTGEGVTVALKTGASAARQILRIRSGVEPREARRAHESLWTSRTRIKFGVSRFLQRLIRSETAANAAARAFSSSIALSNAVVRYFGDQL